MIARLAVPVSRDGATVEGSEKGKVTVEAGWEVRMYFSPGPVRMMSCPEQAEKSRWVIDLFTSRFEHSWNLQILWAWS